MGHALIVGRNGLTLSTFPPYVSGKQREIYRPYFKPGFRCANVHHVDYVSRPKCIPQRTRYLGFV